MTIQTPPLPTHQLIQIRWTEREGKKTLLDLVATLPLALKFVEQGVKNSYQGKEELHVRSAFEQPPSVHRQGIDQK